MARSRYAGNVVIDNHYGTWVDPTAIDPYGPDILDGVQTVEHIVKSGERFDVLASRYYGDSEYWWVIALANRIADPFSLRAGHKLRIPLDIRSILDKVQR